MSQKHHEEIKGIGKTDTPRVKQCQHNVKFTVMLGVVQSFYPKAVKPALASIQRN